MKDPVNFISNRYIPEPNSGCWIWTAYCDSDGYGICCTGSIKAKTRRYLKAHRLAYEVFVEPLKNGQIVCHKCDNPSCVNPDHLFAGTWQDNVDDMMAKGRHKVGGNPHHGETNGNAKLTDKDVAFIRANHCVGIRNGFGSTSNLATRFGVDRSTIQRIVANKNWKMKKTTR